MQSHIRCRKLIRVHAIVVSHVAPLSFLAALVSEMGCCVGLYKSDESGCVRVVATGCHGKLGGREAVDCAFLGFAPVRCHVICAMVSDLVVQNIVILLARLTVGERVAQSVYIRCVDDAGVVLWRGQQASASSGAIDSHW